MADSSTSLHEHRDQITDATMEQHRGIVSLMEELEAIDWYSQRIDAAQDDNLRAILVHNGDEEKEHAMMTLEWLRRRDPVLDQQMRTYLFTDGDILAAENNVPAGQCDSTATTRDGSLNIGSLRGESV
jgi:Uncharacterized conserved protein